MRSCEGQGAGRRKKVKVAATVKTIFTIIIYKELPSFESGDCDWLLYEKKCHDCLSHQLLFASSTPHLDCFLLRQLRPHVFVGPALQTQILSESPFAPVSR